MARLHPSFADAVLNEIRPSWPPPGDAPRPMDYFRFATNWIVWSVWYSPSICDERLRAILEGGSTYTKYLFRWQTIVHLFAYLMFTAAYSYFASSVALMPVAPSLTSKAFVAYLPAEAAERMGVALAGFATYAAWIRLITFMSKLDKFRIIYDVLVGA